MELGCGGEDTMELGCGGEDTMELGCGGEDTMELRGIGRGFGMALSATGRDTVANSRKCSNKPSISIKSGKFLEIFINYCLLSKYSAPWG